MTRLVVVSNRVAADPARPAPGGLAMALRSVLQQRGGLWFGWSGRVARGRPAAPRLQVAGALQTATVDLSRGEYDRFYRGFCNAVLWRACHGLDVDVGAGDAAAAAGASGYRSYLGTNRRYAAALMPLLRDGDCIWVHDFHLIPLGRLLRRAGITQPLGFFLHVPFPAPAQWCALPQAASLVRALLGYDLLGFQTRRDLEAFRVAVEHCCGARALAGDGSIRRGARRLRLEVIPVGVDVDEVRRAAIATLEPVATPDAAGAAGIALRRRLRQVPGGAALVLGVDRLDPAKGLAERLRAYDRLLGMPGIYSGRLSLLQIVTPPRGDAEDAAPLRHELAQLARRINARHGAAGGLPLQVLHAALPHPELMTLLARARVGVVSPLKDGMNLVAKEYVAAQDPADPGVLVLSVHAGAAQELDAALHVDPRDTQAVAEAIRDALRMRLVERRSRHASMLAALRRQDLRGWAARFLERLSAASAQRRAVQPTVTAGSPACTLPTRWNPARPRPSTSAAETAASSPPEV